MKLSVIIPTYNRGSHLRTCLDSLRLAGVDDYEAIVVDDGSTDETAAIVASIAPAVRYLQQENAGPASARNRGFAASRGEFVAFLDSDDHWFPSAASRLIAVLERNPSLPLIFGDAAMGTTDTETVSVASTFGGSDFAALPGVPIEPGVRRLDRHLFFRSLVRRNSVFLGSLIVRRNVVEQVGGFEPTLFGSEDWNFVLRLAARHEFAYHSDATVAFYLQHPGGISRNHDRMEREFTQALRHLAVEPGLNAVDRRWVRRQMARQGFEYAYLAYDRGDLNAARERFARCLQDYPSPVNFGFWVASHLPPDALGIVRRWKRRVLR